MECDSASHWQMGGSYIPFDLFQESGQARIHYSVPLTQRPNRTKRIFKGMHEQLVYSCMEKIATISINLNPREPWDTSMAFAKAIK